MTAHLRRRAKVLVAARTSHLAKVRVAGSSPLLGGANGAEEEEKKRTGQQGDFGLAESEGEGRVRESVSSPRHIATHGSLAILTDTRSRRSSGLSKL
jgi:hypothetical protein